MTRTASFALAVAVCCAAPAFAAGPQDAAFARWKIGDKCIADAQKKFPERDLASQQQRDDQVNRCLVNAGQPPRAGLAPTAPAADTAPAKP